MASSGLSSDTSGSDPMDEAMRILQRLKTLHDSGFLTDDEYNTRKDSVINDITTPGLSESRPRKPSGLSTTIQKSLRNYSIPEGAVTDFDEDHTRLKQLQVIPHPPPDWEPVRAEKALKYRYDYDQDEWQQEMIYVKIDEIPFEKGGLRYVFHLKQVPSPKTGRRSSVSKRSKKSSFGSESTPLIPPSVSKSATASSSSSSSSTSSTTGGLTTATSTTTSTSTITTGTTASAGDSSARASSESGGYQPPKMNASGTNDMDDEDPYSKRWVAKMSQDLRDSVKKDIYFQDVKMQAIARFFCHGKFGYNSYPTIVKKVDFLEAYVLRLIQREGAPVCHMERYIEGRYEKHSNNNGWVPSDDPELLRNTPQAFAHFTYEVSKHQLLICDIQGVNDLYTDPQIHTAENQESFGKGNRGIKGFQAFLATHRCNPICRHLKLPNVNALPVVQVGTVPAKTLIDHDHAGTVLFDGSKSTATAPLMPPIQDGRESTSCCVCVLL